MKNRRHAYKVTIEDESRLENVASFSASVPVWVIRAAIVALVLMAVGACILFLSPARRLMPGYLRDSERTETEMQLLRLDSLRMAYETNQAFLSNIMNVFYPPLSEPIDTAVTASSPRFATDSLLPTSREEEKFVNMMREREKYNISVIAPLAAESLMFSSINDEGVFSQDSRNELRASFIMPKGATVASIADGTVIAVSQTIRDGGSTIIMQHPKGFLSRISRLGTVLVSAGDVVSGGQIIALSNRGNARRGEIVNIEMWYNGDPLVPYEYLGDRQMETPRQPVTTSSVQTDNLSGN